MKLFSFFAISVFGFTCIFADEPIRVLTINIRCSAVQDGENGWPYRKEFMTEIIADGNYDFIGTQETVINSNPDLNQVDYITSKMPKHGSIWRSREVTLDKGECMLLLYKKERWKIDETDQGTFWLSDTPDVPGSKTYPKAGNVRCVTFGLFHELQNNTLTGQKIYVYNTHYDYKSEEARQRAAKLVMDRLADRKDKDAPVIIMGDMNCGEKSPAIRYMQGEPMILGGIEHKPPCRLIDSFRTVNPDAADVGTYNGFKKPGKEKIDFIFVSEPMKPLSSQIIRTQRNGRYPTDHFPVEAVIGR
jgi:endonuclease/exonuclease/phosphatase family metal-dependent hydrolase